MFFAVETSAIDLIAHRANCCGEKENSLLAIKKSWEVGADAVEVDLRISNDNIIYLYHDDTLEGIDVSSYKYSEIIKRHNVPKLSSVLGLGTPTGYYILDIKEESSAFINELINTIRKTEFPIKKLAFQSYNIKVLHKLQMTFPSAKHILISKLSRTFPWSPPSSSAKIIRELKKYNIRHISIKGRRFIDKKFISNLNDEGIRVFVWTINNKKRAKDYMNMGVNGLITDDLLGINNSLGADFD